MMTNETISRVVMALTAALALSAAPLMSGCEDLPGSRTEQSTVIGGAGGAAVGAILAEENRLLGALIGGALGAGAGYLIGAKTDWFEDDDEDVREEAAEAVQNAQTNPATADQARQARTADINDDGFVTMDEIIAMDKAGLTDRQIVDRLEAADQVYDLNQEQRQYLLDHGVSTNVVNRMVTINREKRDQLLSSTNGDVVGRPQTYDDND